MSKKTFGGAFRTYFLSYLSVKKQEYDNLAYDLESTGHDMIAAEIQFAINELTDNKITSETKELVLDLLREDVDNLKPIALQDPDVLIGAEGEYLTLKMKRQEIASAQKEIKDIVWWINYLCPENLVN